MTKLSDVFVLQMGKTPARAKNAYWNDGSNQWVSISDLSGFDKYVGTTKETITDLAVSESGIKIVPENTVIMSFKLTLGKTAITQKPVYTNEAIMAFIPTGKYEIDTNYFYHLFSGRDWSKGTNRAVMGVTLNKATLGEIEIDIPPLCEQTEIADKLDKVDALIADRITQLEKLDSLVKSRFIELFGDPNTNPMKWKKEQLQINATLLNGRAYKQDELLDDGKYPVLRVGNFFSNRGWYYSDLELDEDKYCDDGDLLYAWSASFGPRIWNGGKVIYHYHIWKVLVGEKYNKQFLCHLLDYATASFMGDTHGIGMMHLTKSGMEETEFIVPPIDLQNQFTAFVEQTDKSKLVIQQSLEKLETLKKSLMQQYFG